MKPSLKLQGFLVAIYLILLLASAIVFSHLVVGLLTRQPLAHPVWESLSLGVYLVCIFPFGRFLQRRMAHLRAIGEAPPLPTPEEMELEKKKAQRYRAIFGICCLVMMVVACGVVMHMQSKNKEAARLRHEQSLKLQETTPQ